MTQVALSSVAGVLLSLMFSYVPGLRDWFGTLSADYKRLVMLVALVVVAVAAFGLSCAGIVDAVACDKDGAINLVASFIAALVANQGTYQISPLIRK